MTLDWQNLLEDAVKQILRAVGMLRQEVLGRVPAYYEFIERELESFRSSLRGGSYTVEQAAQRAHELAAQMIRTLTDYISNDEHPVIAALLGLQARARELVTESSQVTRWRAHPGTTVLIGRPARPMTDLLCGVLCEVIAHSPDAAFAYVPNMYIQGQIDPPKQVLFLVLNENARGRVVAVMKSITSQLQPQWPDGDFIEILPVFPDHPFLADVLRTKCLLAINDHRQHSRCLEAAGLGT